MRKLYFICLLFISCSVFAQFSAMGGNLIIFTDTPESFFVYLNGQLQNNEPKTTVRIENLSQNNYSVKIEFANKSLRGFTKNNVSVMSLGGAYFQESTYKIIINSKKNKNSLRYFSAGPILSTINDDYLLQTDGVSNQNVNSGVNIHVDSSIKTPDNYGNEPDYSLSRPRYVSEMNNRDFGRALESIKRERFDDRQLSLAQSILLKNHLNTNQIMQIATLFDFSKRKMEFVKIAYDHCVDVNNYYLINEIFTFTSDQKEFMDFLTNQNSSRSRHVREMDSRDFDRAFQSIKGESFDDGKLSMLRNILTNNFLNTNQIARIVPLFSFGKNQLEFVKNAYFRCVDVKNYFLIKDTFTFDSEKRDFMNFLNHQ